MKNRLFLKAFLFFTLALSFFNYIAPGVSFSYVQNYFGESFSDAFWLLRGFQLCNLVTGLAALVICKWIGHREVFIGSLFILTMATIASLAVDDFAPLLFLRIVSGLSNGLMSGAALMMLMSLFPPEKKGSATLLNILAVITGTCLGIMATSLFTQDYGWKFNYLLSIPALVMCLLLSFLLSKSLPKAQQVEEDWQSILWFSLFLAGVIFAAVYYEEMEGIESVRFVIALSIGLCSGLIFFIRSLTHDKPLLDASLLLYPPFTLATIVIFLAGFHFVGTLSMLAKLLGGVLKMPLHDVLSFIAVLVVFVLISMLIVVVLVKQGFRPAWIVITSLLLIAFQTYTFSTLADDFSFALVLQPAFIGILGAGGLFIGSLLYAMTRVLPPQVTRVAAMHNVIFGLGCALSSSFFTVHVDLERVRQVNYLREYTDEGNPLVQESLASQQALFMANGYAPDEASAAAYAGLQGTIKQQGYFKAITQTYFLVFIVSMLLIAFVLFIEFMLSVKSKTGLPAVT
ncbi:MAG: MFS transporter [Chitinophagales bacterium]|nr:MFS transporter [Chitinophagales bacterium]